MAMLDLVQIAPPAETPIDLDQAKRHVRIDGTSEDSDVADHIETAVGHLDGKDGVLRRALISQTWRLYLDRFPCGRLRLPLPPLQSVTSITYVDASGATQTVSPSDYVVAAGAASFVAPIHARSWPAARCQARSIAVTFVCGYGAAEAVPAPLKSALKLIVADLYENREPATDQPNSTLARLIRPFRIPRT